MCKVQMSLLLGNFCKRFAGRNNARLDRADDTVPVMAWQKLDEVKERSIVTRAVSAHAATVCNICDRFIIVYLTEHKIEIMKNVLKDRKATRWCSG